jgi:hypothetical protein
MQHYVGLDVSLKQTAVCIVDQTGKIKREGLGQSLVGLINPMITFSAI